MRRTVFLAVILASALAGATRIQEIAFRNFDYPWDRPRIAVPAAWRWLDRIPKSTPHVAAGRRDFTSGGYVMVASVTYGDLNGDGRDEAAVELLFSTGGTANWSYLYLFTLANGSPTLIARLRSGSRADGGLVKVAIERNTLVLDFADPSRRAGVARKGISG